MSLAPGTQLGPYEITHQLGSGGMGVVYAAEDPRLDRSVAIKLLPPDLTQDETAKQRFLQEAKAASALDHPNICTIYDVGETDDGQLYLVMAHYDGETLKERIGRGPLPVDEAVDVATQVGQGLAEAHEAGIVHRDIKPANLFLTTSGPVKILDFGLAKLAGLEGVTQTGTTVGTVAYMSPEQARGDEVDHRTDIWSLGVVLYEMLAGTPPFQGDNLLSLAEAIRSGEPESLTSDAQPLNPVVRTAVNKDSGQRYQTVAELVDALQRPSGSPEASAVSRAEPDVPSIAVLPFANLSPDADQDYFCDGLAEELIDALARLDGLRVVARTSAFQFRGTSIDLREVGDKLKVKTVLEGSVRKAGHRLRINAQLINTDDGYHLWSERFDRETDDVFAVQDEIARSVTATLKIRLLGGSDQPLVKRPTENLEAYELYLRGRHHFTKFTPSSFDKGQECFEQALALEPTYAQAHAALALLFTIRTVTGCSPGCDVLPLAREAASKALGFDDTAAEAHLALANVLMYEDWNWPEAEREYRRALDLDPADSFAHDVYSNMLTCLGRVDASLAEAQSAIPRDPISLSSRFHLALALICARRFEEALVEIRAGLELEPTYYLLHNLRGLALAGSEEHDVAIDAFGHAATLAPSSTTAQAWLGWALASAGNRSAAVAIREDLDRRRRQGYVSSLAIAALCVGLGETERAVWLVEQAADERDGALVYVNEIYCFDPIRSDSRFQALLRRMNFTELATSR